MIETQNKKIIKILSKRSFQSDWMRNIIAILAISMTAILFTSITSIGISLLETFQISDMRLLGGLSEVTVKDLTLEEVQRMSTHPYIKEFSYRNVLGFATNKSLLKRQVEISATDELFATWFFANPTEGRMPQNENEIATDTLVLDMLGIPHELGQKVTIEYKTELEYQAELEYQIEPEYQTKPDWYIEDAKTKEFTLSGFWEGDKAVPASQIWISEDYLKKVNEELGQKALSLNSFQACFNLNSRLHMQEKANQILKDSQIGDNIRASVNEVYNISGIDVSTILMAIIAVVVIMLIGYLIIYNIFQISIVKDIRFYGLLKTIGTTRKQIKKIIQYQALLLSFIGIPIGLFAGYIISIIIVPYISAFLTLNIIVSANAWIFLASAIFALLTVYVSCRKPAKTAAKVSPIEAVRYIDNGGVSKKRSYKKSRNGASIWRMAISNLGRNRKKTIFVLLSIGLSFAIFNHVYINVKSFSLEGYLSNVLHADYTIGDETFLSPMSVYTQRDTINNNLMEQLDKLDGLEGAGRIYAQVTQATNIPDSVVDRTEIYMDRIQQSQPRYKTDKEFKKTKEGIIQEKIAKVKVYGYDDYVFSKMELYKGTIDMEALKQGNAIIAQGEKDDSGKWAIFYDVGDKVIIDGMEYKVIAVAEINWELKDRGKIKNRKIPGENIYGFYMTSNVFQRNYPGIPALQAVVDISEEFIEETDLFFKQYQENIDDNLMLESRKDFMGEFESLKTGNIIVGYSLSAILGIIGILNFINTTITGIFARKKEFATMQSIGMTGKQLCKLLVTEGLIYSILSILFVGIVGNLITYFYLSSSQDFYIAYHFTLIPVLICVPLLILMSIAVPALCYYTIKKQSITERLSEIK